MLGTNTSMFIDMQYIENSTMSASGFRRQYLRDDLGEQCPSWSDVPNAEYQAWYELSTHALNFTFEYAEARDRRIRDIRYRLREQTRHTPTTRYNGVLRGFAALKQSLKDFAKAVQDEYHGDVLEELNEVARHSAALASKIYNEHCSSFDFFQCDDCGEYFYYEEQHTTSDDRSICEGCCNGSYLYSECMNIYIPQDEAISVYDSTQSYHNGSADDYCTQRYGRNNFDEYYGSFISDSDAYYDLRGADDEDEDEEDEDRPSNDGLSAYHNGYRDFTEQNASGKYPALGAEIEVYCEDRADVVSALKDIGGLVLERDGSLDDYNGFEIITKPYGREEWGHMVESIFNTLQEHEAVGYNEPAGSNYGIHLTVHRRFLSPLSEARIAMFLVDEVNQNFVRAIAQRAQIYSAHHGVGMGAVVNPNLRSVSDGLTKTYTDNDITKSGKIYGKGKYCPVNFKEGLAEFRIFQSTTNPVSFVKNLEFVWALIKWTNASTGCSHDHRDFLLWLNTPQQRSEFPVLSTFLSKRVFYGTNFTPIISSWQALMRKPLQTEAVEPMAA